METMTIEELQNKSKDVCYLNDEGFFSWQGELGWEVMSWVPICRKKAQEYEHIVVKSFKGMEVLYEDFADVFITNKGNGRSLDYPKNYRPNQAVHKKYGDPAKALIPQGYDVLIHARGIRRKSNINYKKWQLILDALKIRKYKIAWIGTKEDTAIKDHGHDMRDYNLKILCNEIAASKLVIGCSSGVMHLAAACGTDLVVWGDDRTYFGETLEKRYKNTWNPHHVKVNWITAKDWQPDPSEILKSIEKGLNK